MWIRHATSPRGRCILCLRPSQALTAEHLFPEAAGGRIMARILCQACNSRLGHYIDAPFLQHKLVEMARVTYRLAGKTGKIPQPFSDMYSVDTPDGTLTFRLDENFAPRTIPEAAKVTITENNKIKLGLAIDARDRNRLPATIRNTLTRFFRGKGSALGWSLEEQASAIQNAIDHAMQSETHATPISAPLRGKWTLDFQSLYAEMVKVVYEVAYLEFGPPFLDTVAGHRLRGFLLDRCADPAVTLVADGNAAPFAIAPHSITGGARRAYTGSVPQQSPKLSFRDRVFDRCGMLTVECRWRIF